MVIRDIRKILECNIENYLIDDSRCRLNFDLGKKNKIHHHIARMLKLVKLQSLVAKCCKLRKI